MVDRPDLLGVEDLLGDFLADLVGVETPSSTSINFLLLLGSILSLA